MVTLTIFLIQIFIYCAGFLVFFIIIIKLHGFYLPLQKYSLFILYHHLVHPPFSVLISLSISHLKTRQLTQLFQTNEDTEILVCLQLLFLFLVECIVCLCVDICMQVQVSLEVSVGAGSLRTGVTDCFEQPKAGAQELNSGALEEQFIRLVRAISQPSALRFLLLSILLIFLCFIVGHFFSSVL